MGRLKNGLSMRIRGPRKAPVFGERTSNKAQSAAIFASKRKSSQTSGVYDDDGARDSVPAVGRRRFHLRSVTSCLSAYQRHGLKTVRRTVFFTPFRAPSHSKWDSNPRPRRRSLCSVGISGWYALTSLCDSSFPHRDFISSGTPLTNQLPDRVESAN